MESTRDLRDMLIRFYNMQAGTRFWVSSEKNQSLVADAIGRIKGDSIESLKNHIRLFVSTHDEVNKDYMFAKCFDTFIDAEAAEEKKETKVDSLSNDSLSKSVEILGSAVAKIVSDIQTEDIKKDIMGNVEQAVRDFVKSEYGTIERKIITLVDGEKKEFKGVLHEKFDTVLKFVANDEPVFLTGPAGSGKNFICKQVADALGLDFYFTNAVTQEYKLTGFTDANGNYQETQFYKAFTQGGLFMLDEMDASIPEVLVILNAAIANRYFDFPAPIGYVEAHPDFRVVAAGNTFGHGADFTYVGRNQLDGASLDRFAVVNVNYSETIENAMACQDVELADFCREYRKAAEEAGLQTIVSYRAISRLAKMTQLLDVKEALRTCLVKGLGKDDLNIIANKLSDDKYSRALKQMAKVS